nr:MAG TPA: hypothetical protein [Bacteriophage sp.]
MVPIFFTRIIIRCLFSYRYKLIKSLSILFSC